MFNRPKVIPDRASPKRSPFTDLRNIPQQDEEVQDIKGLDGFDWNRKLDIKKSDKKSLKKKFLVNVTDDKGNSENHSPNMRETRAAFGKKRSPNFASQKAESKDHPNSTDEEISIVYEEFSPRYEAKDTQHENLLRIAHKMSPASDTSPSSSVKGPPADLVSPLSTTTKRGSFQQLVGSPALNVAKREIELSPKTPDTSTVSPSQQVTPPSEDDASGIRTNYTSKEDKSELSSDFHNENDPTLYSRSGGYDNSYYYDENYPQDFRIVNQEYYEDTYGDTAEDKEQEDDIYRHNVSLKTLTPVKMKGSVTVVTEPVHEDKSVVDSPESSSSKVTSLSTEIEIEQLFSKVRHNRISDVRTLLEQGARVRQKDANGNSLLHICAQNNLKKMASLILDHGADINAENKKGLTALDYCDNYHFDKLGDWLVTHGADNGVLNLKF